MNKRYWLRGLMTGIIIDLLVFLIVFATSFGYDIPPSFIAGVYALFASPVILIGLLIGGVYGRKQRGTIN